MELAHGGLAQLAQQLESRQVSAVDRAELFRARIERHRNLNAFLDVRPELTLRQARAADARRARGERGPLLGMPIAQRTFLSRAAGPRPRAAGCCRAI